MISVLTPTYNCAKFIMRSYACLRMQSFTSWEWVIVDDGSSDGSSEILEQLASKDSRIRHYRLENNCGRGYARSFGLSKCSHPWIAVWDIDDLYTSNRLELIKTAFDNGYEFFCSYALVADIDLNIKGARHFDHRGVATLTPSFVHATLAFRRDCVGDLGYDITMRAGEDLELMLMLENRHLGFYCEEYAFIYIEDREISLQKTISMHSSHSTSIRKILRDGRIHITTARKINLELKLFTKYIALRILKISPPLYLHSVKYRHKENIKSRLLTKNHLQLFKEFYFEKSR